jgi:hypothetical protein
MNFKSFLEKFLLGCWMLSASLSGLLTFITHYTGNISESHAWATTFFVSTSTVLYHIKYMGDKEDKL